MPLFQTECIKLIAEENGLALLWLDVPGETYNVLSRAVLNELEQTFDYISTCPDIKILVLLGAKKTGFLAGADIHEFATIQTSQEAEMSSERGQRLFSKLENLAIPTVAVIHGPCLGGGLEISLACDYRIVVNKANTQIGLPEIELGLIPGWGGTQRLPRVIGLERAMQVILQRRRLGAKEALKWRLADTVEPTRDAALQALRQRLSSQFIRQGKRLKKNLPLHTWRQRLIESTAAGQWLLFRGAEQIMRRKVPVDMPAPFEALGVLRTGLRRGLAEGLKAEREAIGRLATTKSCRNLVTLFFLIEMARKGQMSAKPYDDLRKDLSSAVQRVGIVGAGTMGSGIAQLASLKGCQVVVQEVNEAALNAGMKKLENLFQKAAERGLLTADEAQKKFQSIGKTTDWEGFADVDVVVEAAIEDLGKKKEIFKELEKRTKPDAILATNTSSLLVAQLQEGLAHPERVAGLHFFNPVHKMPLVEVVRPTRSSGNVIEILTNWAVSLGKTPVVVGDSPGFVVNRILMPYLNEAGILVLEGMPVEKVDGVMRRFGMPMGPLELLDQVGLDVAAHIARAVGPAFAGRLTPQPALEKMSSHGWLGQKSGKGFYVYEGKKKRVHEEALAILKREIPATPAEKTLPSAFLPQQAQDRMVLLMVNEAAACLAEGLGERADVIDLAMVLGTGWAPHRGGPLRYADDRGADKAVESLEKLTLQLGKRFEPCAELRRRAANQEAFYDALSAPQKP